MISGYNLNVKLPELAGGLEEEKREINDNS